MPCNRFDLPGGGYAIICGRRTQKRCSCGRPAIKLCDYPLTGAKAGKTCDKPLCESCAVHREPDTDYCRVHAAMIDAAASEVKP